MLKKLFPLAALASDAFSHYVFPSMTYQGTTAAKWSNVRDYNTSYTYSPVTDVTSADIQCNVGPKLSSGILTVTAGNSISVNADPNIYHPGPGLVYLAKVPSGYTAATWQPSGSVWFKIAELGPTSFSPSLKWTTDSATSIAFTIPKSLPNGDYLVRVEHIGLHVAQSVGGAQFFISCGQLTVTGGGSGSPSPKVAFPGAYSASDPGILINIYYPVPTSYTFPGPKVWTG